MRTISRAILLCILTLIFFPTSIFGEDKPTSTSQSISFSDDYNDMEFVKKTEDFCEIKITGNDPYIYTLPLTENLERKNNVLSFKYFCPKGLDHIEIYFCPPFDIAHSKLASNVGSSEGWVEYSIDLTSEVKNWGNKGDYLRVDLGSISDVEIQIRNMKLRAKTKRELELEAQYEEKKKAEAILEENLKNYLSSDFNSFVNSVSVSENRVKITGQIESTFDIYLCEVTPYQDVTEVEKFDSPIKIENENFEIEVDRRITKDGINYDRILSKWVVAEKDGDTYKLKSHARYADQIDAKYNLPDEKPASRKGLGGFHAGRFVSDLDDLDITSATVNIWFTGFMYTKPVPGRISHNYNGKEYYFDEKVIADFDSTFRLTASKNIIVAAILLVSKAEQCSDPEIGRMLQHPDCDPAGIYSMPNMTNPESVECYAAALDFLASRYSRADKKYGRIHHWIMHNEVDAGWVWTNAGDKTELVFMDTYIKSMRMCYNIARSYNPHSEVFVTLTHYWNWTTHPKFYLSKNLLEILIDYCNKEGDFQWALAQHPYPEDLFEPKTWLDQHVSYDFNTDLITFKNLEVLNAWIKKPEALYKGKYKRTLWLSENGTNSRDYSEKCLKEQAAGFAYTWKKMKDLDGIDGFQWHNWIDNRGEGGLRIGLRRFPDDETDPGGRKPVWFVYQAAGRENEDEVFNQYKELIGINDWDEVNYLGEIDQNKKRNSFRDIKSDTWVATDALGRKLPGYDECGSIKDDRFVGMFYFMTHIQHGGNGPFDVTKIVKENPEDPQWGDGSHYWGEPEIGYYLNQEEWAVRRHAYQLSDAGVDVIIFDVTNDITFPEVYLNVCKVYRRMRSEGERTPDITFLGSEISINKLWDEFYKKGMYPDLWFYWKGKPLILFGQHEVPQRNKMNDVVFHDEITKFFSIRHSWAWTTLPWYYSCPTGKDKWPWVDHYPQAMGWHDSPDEKEMVPVAVAQHPLSNIGRSFHNFHQPENDIYDLTEYTDEGLCFQEQWNRALDVDPKFVFVTGWNEWSAGKQVMGENINEQLQYWKFYPGAHLGKVGEELKTGDKYFIDQYNQEYSRDIEPMKDGHTDNYYYQLIANVRKYKGISKPAETGEEFYIDIKGSFDQWEDVQSVYYDHIGDVAHRNSEGDGQAGPYINNTGRNDIMTSKVARDDNNIYFYAETVSDVTSYTDENWMLLFIDVDRNKETGWEGYDYVINKNVIDSETTTISKLNSKGKTSKEIICPLKVSGNKVMLSVPKEVIGITGKTSFEFHWADNIQKMGDITEFFMNGDNAPERRSNYLFNE
ncbi:MAG: DUF5722 domain-containing protein [Ignavibacteria bacterium]|jgi:hypothetical protein